ncbi:MAG: prefoldin subunit [Candidatus Micrarchaeota archaeon]
MAELTEEQRKDSMDYQQLQNQLQVAAVQKQQLELQIGELTTAIEESQKSTGTIYRFFGNVIVPKEKTVLVKELSEEKESLEVRKNALDKQEKSMRENFAEVRKRLEATMPKGDTGTISS